VGSTVAAVLTAEVPLKTTKLLFVSVGFFRLILKEMLVDERVKLPLRFS
jgi:hypothetical protein